MEKSEEELRLPPAPPAHDPDSFQNGDDQRNNTKRLL